MIDTWLLTALVLGVVTLCVILRSVPVKSPDDRLVAGTVAVTLAGMTALVLSIALGNLMILDLILILVLIGLVILIHAGKQPEADPA